MVWKDYRLAKTSLLIGLCVLALPYIGVLFSASIQGNLLASFRIASMISIALGVLIFPFWSGQMMSAESASGASAFLGTLCAESAKAISPLQFTSAFSGGSGVIALALLLADGLGTRVRQRVIGAY